MDALRKWRKNQPEGHRSQEAVARILGVSHAQVSRYERGLRQVPADRAVAFEKITGISRHVLRPDVFGPPPWETAA
jgi:DNA-binding transcriptional regulator YdaS (Cro superfamily)